MKLFARVPEAVRSVRLEERRLAWGVAASGEALIATPSALHAGDLVLPWTQVEKAVWRPPLLTITEVSEVEGAGTRHVWSVEQEHRLAETVRACVTSSVAWTDVRRIGSGGKVRIVGRRVPGRDALTWQVVYLDGTDPTDPGIRSQAEGLAASLRATLG